MNSVWLVERLIETEDMGRLNVILSAHSSYEGAETALKALKDVTTQANLLGCKVRHRIAIVYVDVIEKE